ncbi:MAG TPA: FMN-binding protein [Pseudolysinimonas sp.]
MRARAVIGGVAASVAVLIAGWELGASGSTTTGTTAAGTGTTTTTANSGTTTTVSSGTTGTTTGAADGTYTGDTVSTRFGDVQVQVTISGGAITDVTALQLTDHDGRSVQISNQAAPMLRSEVLSDQSANVSTIGGATYTSYGYLTSLQSALDQAGF